MKRLVAFPLEHDEGTVVVEVDEPVAAGGVERASRQGEVAETAQQTLEAALRRIRPAARAVIATLAELSPDEVEVEFGIKLGTKTGAIIASADAEATYKVTLKWSGDRPASAPGQ